MIKIVFSLDFIKIALTKPIALGLVVTLTMLIVTTVVWHLYQSKKTVQNLQNGTSAESVLGQSAQEQTRQLIEKVGELIALPDGEEPKVATITNIDKLKNQPFFGGAENGDKVLLYLSANKVILYDPKNHKILNIGSLKIDNFDQQIVKVVIRTDPQATSSGLLKKIEEQIKAILPTSSLSLEQEVKRGYLTSTIIVVEGRVKQQAQQLADTLEIKLGELPEIESVADDVDILIILGKDQLTQ